MASEPSVIHDEKNSRFKVELEGGLEAVLLYRQNGKTLDFYSTYVPPESRAKGVAVKLVEAGFVYAREKGFSVIPTCPYISSAFLPRHPQYLKLTA